MSILYGVGIGIMVAAVMCWVFSGFDDNDTDGGAW